MSEQENTVTEKTVSGDSEVSQSNESVESKNTESSVGESGMDSSEEASKIANLEEEINKLKVENSSLKDSWLRERAEFQNFKRRTANEYLSIKREAGWAHNLPFCFYDHANVSYDVFWKYF
ncbi:MAG: nucleotide exchange factor GrpE, partial [Spirochaetia bacterium]|nr:nucleotide exchange factor GrpE [Spirochaetia bacterium]